MSDLQAEILHTQRQRPHLAVYCLIFEGPKILMLRRIGTKYADGFWSVPAGHVDEGEPLLIAASRETREETGLIISQDAWSLVALMHRRTDKRTIVDVFLRAEQFDGEISNCEPTKHTDLDFYKITDLPGPIVPYVETVITPIRCNRTSPLLVESGW